MTRAPLTALPCVVAALLAACGEGGVRAQQGVAGGDPARGQRLVVAYGCGSCHVLPDVPGAVGRVGPPLERFAERRYIAGRVPNEPQALVRWIMDPQSVDSLTAMPELGVTAAHAIDIAAYLYSDRGGMLGPPHPLPADLLPTH